jgi:hypothetical protein
MKIFRLRYSIIHGEYSYREWDDIETSEMCLLRAVDLISEEFIPDHLRDERQAFTTELLSRGSAMIPGQDRAVMDIRWEEIKPITVTVRGGIVQDIENIPENVRIKVIDWDNDELDGNDDPVPSVGIWKGRVNYSIDYDGKR